MASALGKHDLAFHALEQLKKLKQTGVELTAREVRGLGIYLDTLKKLVSHNHQKSRLKSLTYYGKRLQLHHVETLKASHLVFESQQAKTKELIVWLEQFLDQEQSKLS